MGSHKRGSFTSGVSHVLPSPLSPHFQRQGEVSTTVMCLHLKQRSHCLQTSCSCSSSSNCFSVLTEAERRSYNERNSIAIFRIPREEDPLLNNRQFEKMSRIYISVTYLTTTSSSNSSKLVYARSFNFVYFSIPFRHTYLNSAKIHWILDYIKIRRAAISYRVHRFEKRPSILILHKRIHYLDALSHNLFVHGFVVCVNR